VCVYVRPAYNTALYLGRGVDVTAGRSASACTTDHACVVRRRRRETSCALARRASTARDASAAVQHARRFFFRFLSSFKHYLFQLLLKQYLVKTFNGEHRIYFYGGKVKSRNLPVGVLQSLIIII